MKITISTGGKFHAFHLARQLENRGFLQRIITGYPKLKLRNEGIGSNQIKSFPIPFLFEHVLSKVKFLKKRIPINYIYKVVYDTLASRHVNDCDILIGWSGNCLKSIVKAKNNGAIVVVDRGAAHIQFQDEILREEYNKYGVEIKPIDKLIIRRELLEYDLADYIMVPSHFVKRSFVEKGINENKVLVCPYGVDISRFKKVRKEDSTFRIIFAGAISFQKGVQYLLNAVSELDIENFELVLIGRIENKEMKNLIKNSKNCRFVGRIAQDELYWHYSQGSVFVQPSIQDGFAMTIIEAMACGLPIISTVNVGGSDIVEDDKNGYIINIRDVKAIKDKILKLYNNREMLNRMSENAMKTAKIYTWNRYGEIITKIYSDVYNEKVKVNEK